MTLELQGVVLRLGDRVLVPALDARLAGGEVLAVMGPSGSGKSTLLAWIAGLLEGPFTAAGTVRVDGVDVTHRPTEARRIGLMLQDDWLFPHLDVLDNLLFALPAAAAGTPAARRSLALEALARAGLEGLEAHYAHELSGGQRARVSLVRTLLSQPRAVLLDEPFSRLDAPLRARLRESVWQLLADAGVPALIVTHDPQDVPAGAHIVRLDDEAAQRVATDRIRGARREEGARGDASAPGAVDRAPDPTGRRNA